jgi:hypothetical protein
MPFRRKLDARESLSTPQIEAKSGDSTFKNGWRPWRLLGRCLVIVRVCDSTSIRGNTDDEPHCMCVVADVYFVWTGWRVFHSMSRFALLDFGDVRVKYGYAIGYNLV